MQDDARRVEHGAQAGRGPRQRRHRCVGDGVRGDLARARSGAAYGRLHRRGRAAPPRLGAARQHRVCPRDGTPGVGHGGTVGRAPGTVPGEAPWTDVADSTSALGGAAGDASPGGRHPSRLGGGRHFDAARRAARRAAGVRLLRQPHHERDARADEVLAPCRLPREGTDLRLLRLSYVGFDGEHIGARWSSRGPRPRRRTAFRDGVRSAVAHPSDGLVDAYRGADDRSMAANNTSAYNCRRVAGSLAGRRTRTAPRSTSTRCRTRTSQGSRSSRRRARLLSIGRRRGRGSSAAATPSWRRSRGSAGVGAGAGASQRTTSTSQRPVSDSARATRLPFPRGHFRTVVRGRKCPHGREVGPRPAPLTRRRMGIEPTRPRSSASTVLKTAGDTSTPNASIGDPQVHLRGRQQHATRARVAAPLGASPSPTVDARAGPNVRRNSGAGDRGSRLPGSRSMLCSQGRGGPPLGGLS